MNITAINTKNEYQRKNQEPNFMGPWLSSAFMAINRHEIIGVSAIDLMSMVIPRTLIDFTRNKEAGTETLFREGSSTVTNASIGLAGIGAASLLALALRGKNYGVDFKSINANSDTIDAMANLFKSVVDQNPAMGKEDLTKTFLNRVFENVQGIGGNTDIKDSKIWYKLEDVFKSVDGTPNVINTKESIITTLLEQQKNKSYKLNASTLGRLKTFLNIDIPSAQDLKVNLGGKEVMTKGEHFLADVHALTKAFTQDNVLKTFKNASDGVKAEFVKDLKTLSIRKTVLGLAAICSLGLSWQAINRHMTQKRTGIKGFVGDPNYGKEDSEEKKNSKFFLPLKGLTAAAMGAYILKTIKAKNFKDFVSKIQFKGNLPTMEQIKLVYGSIILGRLLASNDKNELRESAFRDFMGFTNFLVLGALITKWFVNKMDKSLINYDVNTHGKGLWNWIKNTSIKTHEEVINNVFKTDVLKDGGIKSIKELYNSNWIQPGTEVARKLSILNKARLLAIGYACVALGIVVPLINKYITNKKSKNENALKEINQNDAPKQPVQNDEKSKQIINDFLHKNVIA